MEVGRGGGVGEGSGGGGRKVEEGMGEEEGKRNKSIKSIKMDGCKMHWWRAVTCSVLKMSFVFCQLEFLASTITLNPFSRTSSLEMGIQRGRE